MYRKVQNKRNDLLDKNILSLFLTKAIELLTLALGGFKILYSTVQWGAKEHYVFWYLNRLLASYLSTNTLLSQLNLEHRL